MPRLDAYLHTERGHQAEPQAYGIGLVVTDGTFEHAFSGYGYSNDGEFQRLATISRLLDQYPDNAFRLFTKGVKDRLGHWRNGKGRKSDGGLFVGNQFLRAIDAAEKSGSLVFLAPPHGFTPAFQRAKFAAKDALSRVQADSNSSSYVQVALEPHTLLDFRKLEARHGV